MATRETQNPKLSVTGATKVYATRSGDLLALDGCSLAIEGQISSMCAPSTISLPGSRW